MRHLFKYHNNPNVDNRCFFFSHRPAPDEREHLGDLLGVGGEPFPGLCRDPATVAGHELDDEESELGPLLLVRQHLGMGRVEPRDGHRDRQLHTVVGQERVHLVTFVLLSKQYSTLST